MKKNNKSYFLTDTNNLDQEMLQIKNLFPPSLMLITSDKQNYKLLFQPMLSVFCCVLFFYFFILKKKAFYKAYLKMGDSVKTSCNSLTCSRVAAFSSNKRKWLHRVHRTPPPGASLEYNGAKSPTYEG